MPPIIKKAVILAGGFGTRLAEETSVRPKPLVEIGGRPILWHIMKIYHSYGIDEFIICLGYKGYLIKEYFSNYFLHMSDVTFDFSQNSTTYHNRRAESWKITLVDTGEDTMTGGRIKRISPFLEKNEHFCMTYGDGVGDLDIKSLIEFHFSENREATVSVVRPPGRFGAIVMNDNAVSKFQEKPEGDGGWINGGFFVLSPSVFDYISSDSTVWEKEPLEKLASKGQLSAFRHKGFWQPMDTLRDKNYLEDLWSSGQAPWCVWKQQAKETLS